MKKKKLNYKKLKMKVFYFNLSLIENIANVRSFIKRKEISRNLDEIVIGGLSKIISCLGREN